MVFLLLVWSGFEARRGLSDLERLRAEAGPRELLDGSAAARLEAAEIGSGLTRVFLPRDVAWLTDASAERLGRRASSLVRIALAPFG